MKSILFVLFVVSSAISKPCLAQEKYSLEELSVQYPSGNYYNALKFNPLFKTFIKFNSSDNSITIGEKTIDKREVSWRYGEIDSDGEKKFYSSMRLSDTLYKKDARNRIVEIDSYVLIPSKDCIVSYRKDTEGITLNEIYMKDKMQAKSFKEQSQILNMIEEMEENIIKYIEEQVLLKENELLARTANAELPQAKFTDNELEKKLLIAMRDYAKQIGWTEEYSSVIITSDYWFNKNEYSERIVGRSIEIAAVAKWQDGSCSYQLFNMRQDAIDNTGKKFGEWKRYATGSKTNLDCNKVK